MFLAAIYRFALHNKQLGLLQTHNKNALLICLYHFLLLVKAILFRIAFVFQEATLQTEKANFKKTERSFRLLCIGLFLLLVFSVLLSLTLGRYTLSALDVCKILLSKLFAITQTWPTQAENIVFLVRMPRIFAAVIIGGSLAAAGSAFQNLFQNPLVSPDVLGASAGAGFGAALGIFIGAGYVLTTLFAFAGGLFAVGIAFFVSLRAKNSPTLSMVLAGIMTGALASAATSFLKLIADTENTLPAITYWLMGSLSSIRWSDLLFLLLPFLVGTSILFAFRWQLHVLSSGEEEAAALGISTKKVRTIVILGATLLTASSVSISGLIGWVGLVIPHFARMLAGANYRRVLPISMLMGSIFLLLVDNLSRTLVTGEIPIGILTAFVGAPFFLYLLLKKEEC